MPSQHNAHLSFAAHQAAVFPHIGYELDDSTVKADLGRVPARRQCCMRWGEASRMKVVFLIDTPHHTIAEKIRAMTATAASLDPSPQASFRERWGKTWLGHKRRR